MQYIVYIYMRQNRKYLIFNYELVAVETESRFSM